MSAMRYLSAAGVYAFILIILYGKREAVPREYFTKKDHPIYKIITEKKRKDLLEVNFTKEILSKGGVAKYKAEVRKDK